MDASLLGRYLHYPLTPLDAVLTSNEWLFIRCWHAGGSNLGSIFRGCASVRETEYERISTAREPYSCKTNKSHPQLHPSLHH